MRHDKMLGGIWFVVGAAGVLGIVRTLWSVFRDPAGGYDVLPFFLLFLALPLAVYALAGGWAIYRRRPRARSFARGLSAIALVAGVFLLFNPIAPQPIRPLGVALALLALGLYGLFVDRTLQGEPRTLVRRFYEEVVNRRNAAAAEAILAPELVDHGVPPGFPPGRDGFLRFAASLTEAFPDLHVTIDEVVAEGERIAARVTVEGTHQGVLLGRIAPTGRRATWTGIDLFHVRGGRIVERWNQRDLLGLFGQLGVDSPPKP